MNIITFSINSNISCIKIAYNHLKHMLLTYPIDIVSIHHIYINTIIKSLLQDIDFKHMTALIRYHSLQLTFIYFKSIKIIH